MYRTSNKGRKDIAGYTFSLLTVLFYYDTHRKSARWLCECACGNFKVVDGKHLRFHKTKSCGCLGFSHKMSKTRIYKIWKSMRSRVSGTRREDRNYRRYKERGITVCEEWRTFEPFMMWALSHGYTDELTIDRIDVNGNYCPENCRWATQIEQANNTTKNRFITFEGRTETLASWERLKGFAPKIIVNRLRRGWPEEKALTTPVKSRSTNFKKIG